MWAGPLWSVSALGEHVCSLGYGVLDWLEANTCHGPGDVAGQPLNYTRPDELGFDSEFARFVIEAYRVDPTTGERLWDEAVLSRPKGRAKSELAGLLCVAEAFGAPVRFSHWDAAGQPVGRDVTSPFVRILATEEGQAGNTYDVVAFVVAWGIEHRPEIYAGADLGRSAQSSTRIYVPGGGEIRPSTAGAASKDGGRESFVVCDETHLYVLPELVRMYATVRRNLVKRAEAQPWMLQTTTMFRPGEQSVAEATFRAHAEGPTDGAARLLLDHRQATGRIDPTDRAHTLRQLRHVYGSAAAWMHLDRVWREMTDPRTDPADAIRYFLNRRATGSDSWLDPDTWTKHARPDLHVAAGEPITIGFDGSIRDDATVLIGCRLADGHLFVIGIWARPDGPEGSWWEVPRAEVRHRLEQATRRFDVRRVYADPHEWRSEIEDWGRTVLPDRVYPWETNRDRQMHAALDRLRTDVLAGHVTNDGNPTVTEHVGNTYVRRRAGYVLIRKEHPLSPRKIDAVVGAALAYEARADELATVPEPARGKQASVAMYTFD